MNNVVVIDNAIPVSIQQHLEQLCLGVYFPWHYHHTSAYTKDYQIPESFCIDSVDTPFFSHLLWDNEVNSDFFNEFRPVVEAIPDVSQTKLARLKLNLTTPYPHVTKQTHSYPHVDMIDSRVDYKTAIYYTNDSTGDTVIFNERVGHTGPLSVQQRVQPRRGRLVIFDGKLLHCGNNPESGARVVANINLILD